MCAGNSGPDYGVWNLGWGFRTLVHSIREQGSDTIRQHFGKINPLALCRMNRRAGRWLENIAMVQEELLLWARYCQRSEEDLEMNGMHAAELELVEIGNWLNAGPKQKRGIKNDFSAFYHLRFSNSTCSLRIPAPLVWTNNLTSFPSADFSLLLNSIPTHHLFWWWCENLSHLSL